MLLPGTIEDYLRQGMNCEHVQVAGDGQHFEALIVSSEFAGKNRVQRHQRVYRALGDRMQSEIHALSMQTLTPDEWVARGGAQPAKG
jgi:acid stress-induced BolA-like protein IbaG/YrbA